MRPLQQSPPKLNNGVVWVFDNPDINVYLAFTVKIAVSHLRKLDTHHTNVNYGNSVIL